MMKLIRSYFWWTYARGSLHYDIMVTAILLFIFLSPHWIDYKDHPVTTVATHQSEVLVREAGRAGNSARFLFQIRAEDMPDAHTDAEKRAAILRMVEPVSGEVTLERYEALNDKSGRVAAYNAWVLK